MSSTTARVTLRYRPAADVLSGLIHLGDVGATRTDTPDADTSVVWAQVTDGQFVGDHLVSYQIIFAAARLQHGPLPLPPALAPTIQSLITTAQHAVGELDDPMASLRAKAEATTELPLQSLRLESLNDLAAHGGLGDRRQAAQLSHALSQLADAVQIRVPAHDLAATSHVEQLSQRLHELSSSIRGQHGRTAPGTTAATRLAARQASALTAPQHDELEAAMTALDDRRTWGDASATLQQLLLQLDRPQP
jgi:hypothetical protein